VLIANHGAVNYASAPRFGEERRSASSDCRYDGERLTRRYGSVEALEEADVFIGEKEVDEPAKVAVLIEQAFADTGMCRVE
jgi:hypothetical protein